MRAVLDPAPSSRFVGPATPVLPYTVASVRGRHADLIASFAPWPGVSMGRRFLEFNDELERLLGRKVDLMTDRPIANPYLRAAVDGSRKTVYA